MPGPSSVTTPPSLGASYGTNATSPNSKSTSSNSPNSEQQPQVNVKENPQMMLYYMIGGMYLRPVGLVSGTVERHLENIVPYGLRRSCGELQLVQYEPENMQYDYNYVMEVGIASRNASSITFSLSGDAKLNVYGEMFGGYCFVAPTILVLKGTLNLAYRTAGGLAEEKANCSALIDVTEGVVSVFVCDNQQIVLMYDQRNAKFCINVLKDEGDQAVGGDPSRADKVAETITQIQQLSNGGGSGDASKSRQTNANDSFGKDNILKTPASAEQQKEMALTNSNSGTCDGNGDVRGEGSKLKIMVKRKVPRKPSNLLFDNKNELESVKTATSSGRLQQSKSFLQQVLASLTNISRKSPAKTEIDKTKPNSESSPPSSLSGKKFSGNQSKSLSPSKLSKKTKNNVKSKSNPKRPPIEPNVKLAKSKFSIATPSSSHCLKPTRSKGSNELRTNSRTGKGVRPTASLKRMIIPSGTDIIKRPPSSTISIKSNASGNNLQTEKRNSNSDKNNQQN